MADEEANEAVSVHSSSSESPTIPSTEQPEEDDARMEDDDSANTSSADEDDCLSNCPAPPEACPAQDEMLQAEDEARSMLPPQDGEPPSSSPTSHSSESPIKRRQGSKAGAGRAQSKKLRKTLAPASRQPLGSIPEHEQPPATLADLASRNAQRQEAPVCRNPETPPDHPGATQERPHTMTEIDLASDQEHAERGGTAATDLQLESEQRAMQAPNDLLREVAAPGCVQYSRRVFAECCSLGRVGVSHETEDSNTLAPGAQLGKYAFESCLTLTTITFDMDHTNKPRALPEGAFCGSGIEQLCLPSDFHNIGPRACENCKRLMEVNLLGTEITALLSSTFAHCVALHCIWLPPRLTQIGKEAFLNCVMLQEVVIPTELSDIGNRAFCGCEQLQRFTPLDWGDIEQWVQAEHNAFFMCDKFERPQWVELLSADGPDSDAFDEDLYQEYS